MLGVNGIFIFILTYFVLIIDITEPCVKRSENTCIFSLFDESNMYVLDQWNVISMTY
jgi:hypothetical protein